MTLRNENNPRSSRATSSSRTDATTTWKRADGLSEDTAYFDALRTKPYDRESCRFLASNAPHPAPTTTPSVIESVCAVFHELLRVFDSSYRMEIRRELYKSHSPLRQLVDFAVRAIVAALAVALCVWYFVPSWCQPIVGLVLTMCCWLRNYIWQKREASGLITRM